MSELDELRKRKAEELVKNMSYPNEPVKVTDEDFDEFVEKHDLALIDLWADWCAPCKRLEPILEELAEEADVAIGKLNVDENRDIPSRYGVTAIPTMLVFKGGEAADRLQGLMPKEKIKQALEKASGTASSTQPSSGKLFEQFYLRRNCARERVHAPASSGRCGSRALRRSTLRAESS